MFKIRDLFQNWDIPKIREIPKIGLPPLDAWAQKDFGGNLQKMPGQGTCLCPGPAVLQLLPRAGAGAGEREG